MFLNNKRHHDNIFGVKQLLGMYLLKNSKETVAPMITLTI